MTSFVHNQHTNFNGRKVKHEKFVLLSLRTYFDIGNLVCRYPWKKNEFHSVRSKLILFAKETLPDKISAMSTKSWCFEKARNEFVTLDCEYIFLSNGSTSSHNLFFLIEFLWSSIWWHRHWCNDSCCMTQMVNALDKFSDRRCYEYERWRTQKRFLWKTLKIYFLREKNSWQFLSFTLHFICFHSPNVF